MSEEKLMRYWYDLADEVRIYVEACIYDVNTPCTEDPARCCLADYSAGLRAVAAQIEADPDPF